MNVSSLPLAAFERVWRLFYRFPLPFLPKWNAANLPDNTRALAPLAGALAGGLFLLVSSLSGFLAGKTFSILLTSVGGAVLLEFITGFAGLKALCAWIARRREGASASEALDYDPEESPWNADFTTQIVPLSILILRALLLGLLAAHGGGVWFILAMTGGCLVQAELGAFPDELTGYEILPSPDAFRMRHWFTAGAVMLLAGLVTLHPGSGVLAFFVSWAGTKYASSLLYEQGGTINASRMALFGYAVETILFLLGAILLN